MRTAFPQLGTVQDCAIQPEVLFDWACMPIEQSCKNVYKDWPHDVLVLMHGRAQEVPLMVQLWMCGVEDTQAEERGWLLRLLIAGLQGPLDGDIFRCATQSLASNNVWLVIVRDI